MTASASSPMFYVLPALLVLLVATYGYEYWAHRKRLAQIKIRIHVNGSRGKSSVTRLLSAGLRSGGIRAVGKTTGTMPRVILPDGRELPVYRPMGANIIEQVRVTAVAQNLGAEALVLECMALQPTFQWLCEGKLVRATHGVITNVRPDHLDVMGPDETAVAQALCGMVPRNGVLYSAEDKQRQPMTEACTDRSSRAVFIEPSSSPEAEDGVTDEEMAGFAYHEHRSNVALALRICADLGVDRKAALEGMWNAQPDPGALTEHHIQFFGRSIMFLNGFAANDPVSTRSLWEEALTRYPDYPVRVALFNPRADRADRTQQLARAYASWTPADHLMLMGTGTYLFARTAMAAGVDNSSLGFLEGLRIEEVFERLVSLAKRPALVVGMGNVAGQGLELVQYFENRSGAPMLEQQAT
ncbi:MAG: poly-gamma-glutamate synthase PgsB [Myxococcales bacterium]|nr:poly-gamma-glutamate synthase PgsB [Myxococcales bacterium]